MKTSLIKMDLYVVRDLFMSVSASTSFASTLMGQTRLIPKVVEDILSVEPGSLVVTDLPYSSVAKITKRYVVLHKDAVHSFLAASGEGSSGRETSLPSHPGYYLSTIFCGTRIIVSGFMLSAHAEAATISSHAWQLGAEVWITKSIEDVLHYFRSNKPLYIVVPNSNKAFQFLGALLTHKNYIKNQRIESVISDTDIQQLAKALITKDLIYQLMHNRASPQTQLKLLSSECFIPILYRVPLRYIGEESSTYVSALLLAGATLVRSGWSQAVTFYAAMEAKEAHKISTVFAPSSTQKAYIPSSSELYHIPRAFGQYKGNLAAHFLKHLLPCSDPDISTIDQCKHTASASISAVGQGDFALSILSGADSSVESCLIGVRYMLQTCGYKQIVTYSEKIIDGLIAMTLGYQSASMQAKTKSIFKSQNSIMSDNYLSIKYAQGRYSELITLLRARPLVCSFYIPKGFAPLSNALLTSLNSALTEYIQLTICENPTQWHQFRDSSLFALLQSGLQLPSADVTTHITTDSKDTYEPSLKQSQSSTDIDAIWCKLHTNDKLLKDLMSMLIHSSISFIPYSMLTTLYPFVQERLFLVVDPSLLLLMSAYLADSASYKDIDESLERAIPKILENIQQFYITLIADTFSFEKEPSLTYSAELSKDLEECISIGGSPRRSYSYIDAITTNTPDLSHETVSLISHFRSMIWLQLVIELLYLDCINVLLSNREGVPAQTPFCLFSELTRPCSVCSSNPASPEASSLLSSLCNNIHTVMEFTGLDLTKAAHLGNQSPPGYLHWSMLASMDAKTIMDVGETIIERGCKRIEANRVLCRTCCQLNRILRPRLNINNLTSYRQSLYNRIARVLITSLLLVWHDDNRLITVAKRAGITPENVSSLNFVCMLDNSSNHNTRLNAIHLPTFLTILFKERGNYGVAEAKGRREYSLMYQNATMMHQSVARKTYDVGAELFNDLESTAIVSHSSTIVQTERSNQQLYNYTVPEDSYDDPRFQRRPRSPSDPN